VTEREVQLGEVADLVRGISFRPGELAPDSTDAVPLLRATNIGDHTLDLTDVLYVPTRLVREAQHLRRFDVVIAMSSGSRKAVGRLAPLRQTWGGCVGAFCGVIRPKPDRIDPAYLGYVLQSTEFRERIETYAVGTAIMNLSRDRLLGFQFRLPPPGVQRRIARILGALDDKIELNRRLSKTLQLTAGAMFKSWFVAEAGTEADGWRSCTIGDLAEVVGGSTPSTTEPRFWNGSHYWATPKDLAGLKTPVLLRTARMLTDAGIGQISSGLLPAGTVLMSSRAPIGYVAITEVPVAINQGFIAMKPRPGVSGLFLLHWAASSQDQILSRANGSTFLEISKSSFRPIEVLAPPADAMDSFDRVVGPIHERVVANERQIGMLAEIRDALLPRLLSGELRGSEAKHATVGA
jgi:type I restriction enzyme S subunit